MTLATSEHGPDCTVAEPCGQCAPCAAPLGLTDFTLTLDGGPVIGGLGELLAMAQAAEMDADKRAAQGDGLPDYAVNMVTGEAGPSLAVMAAADPEAEELAAFIDQQMSERLGQLTGTDPAALLAAVNETRSQRTSILPADLQHQKDQPRTLRQILFTHRALAQADPEQITDLMSEVQRWRGWISYETSTAVIADARQQLECAKGHDRLFGSAPVPGQAGQHEAQWRQANPGLVALIEAAS